MIVSTVQRYAIAGLVAALAATSLANAFLWQSRSHWKTVAGQETRRADGLADKVLQADETVAELERINDICQTDVVEQATQLAALQQEAARKTAAVKAAEAAAAKAATARREWDAARRARADLPTGEEMTAAFQDAARGL